MALHEGQLSGSDMLRRERLIYASHEQGLYRVSIEPPDAPVRRSVECETRAEVDAMAARRRARIVWWPPPPRQQKRVAP